MKELELTSRFKKDLKRIQNNQQRILNVKRVLEFLQDEVPLPSKYRMHKLTGNYNGCWECHVENDFLLIWIDEEENIIKLLRLGSHSELF